jgi:hypothetical protein
MRLCEEVGRAPGVKDLEVSIWEVEGGGFPKYLIV